MHSTRGEHLQYTVPAPGTPAPCSGTVSRVVAAVRSPITESSITRLASRGAAAFHPTASLLPAYHSATPDPSTCVYVPYRHIHTGERAMVPLRVDPTTGVRIPVVPPPPGFQPAVDGLSSGPPNFLQWLAGLLCHHPAEPPEGSRADHAQTPVPATRQRLSPIDIRQPNFDDDAADGAVGSQLCILSTKTLTSLKTKLELADINNWITDFMAAFGRLHDNTGACIW